MKKVVLVIGLIIELIWLIFVSQVLSKINILQYLLCSMVVPVVILFMASFVFSIISTASAKKTLFYSVLCAIVMAAILVVFGYISIDTEIMDIIIANTVTSDNMQVSLNQANAGDNIQSFIIFIAIGGIGSLLGNKLSKKDKNIGEGIEEYDI